MMKKNTNKSRSIDLFLMTMLWPNFLLAYLFAHIIIRIFHSNLDSAMQPIEVIYGFCIIILYVLLMILAIYITNIVILLIYSWFETKYVGCKQYIIFRDKYLEFLIPPVILKYFKKSNVPIEEQQIFDDKIH
jgi:hypothetical protein